MSHGLESNVEGVANPLQRMPCVGAQVQQHLLQQGRVGRCVQRFFGQFSLEVHGRGQAGAHQGQAVFDERAQRLVHQPVRLPAAERQDLAHQLARPQARLVDLRQAHLRGMACGDSILGKRVLRQGQVAQDAGQDVVEVVRNAPGEGADGLHFLGLSQLRLQGLAGLLGTQSLAHVAEVEHDALDRAVPEAVVAQRRKVAPATVCMRKAMRRLGAAVAHLAHAVEVLVGTRHVVRVDPVEQVRAGQRLRRSPQQRSAGRADVQRSPVVGAQNRELLRLLGEGAKAPLAGFQRQLGLPRRGDVFNGALEVADPTLLVAHHVGVFADPDPLAGLVAVDLGDEVQHLAVAFDQLPESLPPVGVDIPLGGDVVDRGQQRRLAVVAVESHQCRVGPQLPPRSG